MTNELTFNTESIERNRHLLELFLILREVTDTTFLVGGVVRDLVCGKDAHDFDVVTDFDILKLAPILEQNGWQCKETGTVFKILFVSKVSPESQQDEFSEAEIKDMQWCQSLHKTSNKVKNVPSTFEIANFRKDSLESDGRRPESVEVIVVDKNISIEKAIIEDALRRDFPINSLFLEPFTMKIIDPTGNGISDIKTMTLRFNLSAEQRIKEDFLRVWRAFRFTLKGFTLSVDTLEALRDLFELAHRSTTPERIRAEIEKMLPTSILENSKGRIAFKNPIVCGNFLVDEVNKTFSFNGRVQDVVLNSPISIFETFSFIFDGFTPVPQTLRETREFFKQAHSLVEPQTVRVWLENMLAT